MALKKSDLRAILKNEDATIDEKVSELLDKMHEEVDIYKDKVDELSDELEEAKKGNNNDDADKWQKKYEKEHEDFEAYKNDQTSKQLKAQKTEAFKDILNDAGLSEEGKAKALKYTNLDDMEIDKDGKIKGAKDVLKSVREEWSSFVTTTETHGTETHGKDGAGSGGGGTKMTKEQIFEKDEKGRYKLTTAERQKAIAENHDLFGF